MGNNLACEEREKITQPNEHLGLLGLFMGIRCPTNTLRDFSKCFIKWYKLGFINEEG
jgi:hypothetical protein